MCVRGKREGEKRGEERIHNTRQVCMCEREKERKRKGERRGREYRIHVMQDACEARRVSDHCR